MEKRAGEMNRKKGGCKKLEEKRGRKNVKKQKKRRKDKKHEEKGERGGGTGGEVKGKSFHLFLCYVVKLIRSNHFQQNNSLVVTETAASGRTSV